MPQSSTPTHEACRYRLGRNGFRTLTVRVRPLPWPLSHRRGANFSLILSAPLPRWGRGRGLGLSAPLPAAFCCHSERRLPERGIYAERLRLSAKGKKRRPLPWPLSHRRGENYSPTPSAPLPRWGRGRGLGLSAPLPAAFCCHSERRLPERGMTRKKPHTNKAAGRRLRACQRLFEIAHPK